MKKISNTPQFGICRSFLYGRRSMFRSALFIFSWGIGMMHPLLAEMVPMDLDHALPLKQIVSRKELNRAVTKAIRESNPRTDWLSNREVSVLSREVIETAKCYGIDPLVFTSLVRRESAFRLGAVSETGAVGLTQMTRQGIREVLERTSEGSRRKHAYLQKLVSYCNPNFYKRAQADITKEKVNEWRTQLVYSSTDALIMGAVLFKVNLLSVKPSRKVKSDFDVYKIALQKYNGDPKVKIEFAQSILKVAKGMVLQAKPTVALNEPKFQVPIVGI